MPIINENELINSLNIINGEDVMFLLGAGCSIQSGCLAANKLINEFKKRIFCSAHGISFDLNPQFDDERLNNEINEYFKDDLTNNPYSYYFEKCFPDSIDRNQFIKEKFHSVKPSFGYLCFADYLISKGARNVLTTNFDLLIERAIRKLDENFDLTNVSENENPILNSRLNIIKLHGDYNYDSLKNTENELHKLDENLANKLLNQEAKKIVILGYSGQDQSVMDFLYKYVDAYPNVSIIWCGIEESCENEKINRLISKTPNSSFVTISGFDSLFEKYYKTYGSNNSYLKETYCKLIDNNSFDLICQNQSEDFKVNAFAIKSGAKVYKSIDDIEESLLSTCYFSMKNNGITYLVSNYNWIAKAFNKFSIEPCLIEKEQLSVVQKCKLIKELIKWNVQNNNKSVFKDNIYLDDNNDIKTGIKINVDLINGNICLLLFPNFFVTTNEITDNQKFEINRMKSSLFTKNNWTLLNSLIKSIFNNDFSFYDDKIGVSFSNDFIDKSKINDYYDCADEPIMIGDKVKSVNQLSILDNYGPRQTLFSNDSIRVGVFCCEEDKEKLSVFINEVINGTFAAGTGIIPKYKGFTKIFKKNIEFDFNVFARPFHASQLKKYSIHQVVDAYIRGLDKMYKEKQIDLALIYVSNNLSWIRNNNEINFHDAIKLKAANKFKTQFLEESTLDSRDNRSKILYNFAIGIYTKTIGMPWYPSRYSKDTLYLGISFGKDSNGITVGCSQMFDGAGRGMQLIISQISEKKTRKNQYLSENEAFELGKKIRATYYKSSKVQDLKKIVIHRTDPFRNEEISGFRRAFEGIDDFILLQIVEDTTFNVYPFSSYGCSGFPIKRGTIIKTAKDTAYIWTDGSIKHSDIDNGRTYRNSKRGMGKPLKIRIFYGNISINEVANDLMYLTKMDFNSSDVLYSKLPVTIKYSRIVCNLIKQGNFDDELISFEYVM